MCVHMCVFVCVCALPLHSTAAAAQLCVPEPSQKATWSELHVREPWLPRGSVCACVHAQTIKEGPYNVHDLQNSIYKTEQSVKKVGTRVDKQFTC